MQRKSRSRLLSILGTGVIALLIVFAGYGPAPVVEAQSTCGATYTVQSGDTMYGIARACGVAYADLRSANNGIADPNLIFPGQILNVPSGSIPSTGGPGTGSTYTVVSGDTMFSIASRYGISLAALESANPGIANPNLIFPGQVINIPAGSIPSTGGSNSGGSSSGGSTGGSTGGTSGGIPATGGTTYTVQPGDTLYTISFKFNTTVPLLMQMNLSVTNMNLIYPGMVLRVR